MKSTSILKLSDGSSLIINQNHGLISTKWAQVRYSCNGLITINEILPYPDEVNRFLLIGEFNGNAIFGNYPSWGSPKLNSSTTEAYDIFAAKIVAKPYCIYFEWVNKGGNHASNITTGDLYTQKDYSDTVSDEDDNVKINGYINKEAIVNSSKLLMENTNQISLTSRLAGSLKGVFLL